MIEIILIGIALAIVVLCSLWGDVARKAPARKPPPHMTKADVDSTLALYALWKREAKP